MSASSEGSFANDDAYELVVAFRAGGANALVAILANVANLDENDYLQAPEASMAVAAAEIVAAARDGDESRLPEKALPMFRAQRQAIIAAKLEGVAHKALTRVLENSELKALWEEGGDDYAKPWKDVVSSIAARLAAGAD